MLQNTRDDNPDADVIEAGESTGSLDDIVSSGQLSGRPSQQSPEREGLSPNGQDFITEGEDSNADREITGSLGNNGGENDAEFDPETGPTPAVVNAGAIPGGEGENHRSTESI